MEIKKTRDGGTLTVAVKGELDTMTSSGLEKELRAELPETTELILDMKELEYISSAGMRVLLGAQKVMNRQGTMTVIHVNPEVMETFEITGFLDMINVEDSQN